jgi:K+-sensing histidine kinase KdpD
MGDEVLLMRVEDEGPGIDADDSSSLFDMFFLKKDGLGLRVGCGLGLKPYHSRIWAANRSAAASNSRLLFL